MSWLSPAGVEVSTGSLGQGLSMCLGIALALRLDGLDDTAHVFGVLSDGDCQEGQTWEAATAAPHFGVSNITAIVDYNHLQTDGTTEEVMDTGDVRAKFEAFGWDTVEIDGHEFVEAALKASSSLIGQAACIGDARSYNTALIVLDSDFAPAWAAQHGIEDASLEALAHDDAMRAAVYVGGAENDASFTPEAAETLDKALTAADVEHTSRILGHKQHHVGTRFGVIRIIDPHRFG